MPPDDVARPLEPALEARIAGIVDTIQAYADLRFGARASVGPDGDLMDALAAGVNFLGEELEASFTEIERRVAARTAELEAATRELGRQALHDALTGLANRSLLLDRLAHRAELARRQSGSFALLFVDLDRFKAANDTLGHLAGDRLLVEFAARLRASLRESDTAARMGGDEFAILLHDVDGVPGATAYAGRLGEALFEPYDLSGTDWTTAASIGVVVVDGPPRTIDELMGAADAAMYEAKRRGGGRHVCRTMRNRRRGARRAAS